MAFGHFLQFESLGFSNFVYNDRLAWYLKDPFDHRIEKKFRFDRNENCGGLILYIREGIPCHCIELHEDGKIKVMIV